MDLTDTLKSLFIDTAKALKGSARRLFMARTVKELGPGGQQRAARELGWGRMTIRKGLYELDSGVECIDAVRLRGRKPAEHLYTRLSAAEVRRQLIAQKGYSDVELPTAATISAKLNARGYYPPTVTKSR